MLHTNDMENIVKGLPGPSAKIRALNAAGVKTADIARFLNIRYQHAYNVIKQSKEAPSSETGQTQSGTNDNRSGLYVEVGPAGKISIPPHFLAAIGVKEGEEIFLKLDSDQLRVMSRTSALKEARTLLKQYLPEGVDLAGELIESRRKDARAEDE